MNSAESAVDFASIKFSMAAALMSVDHEPENVEVAIRQLKQAILFGSYAQVAKSYKAIHNAGPVAIEPLLRELRLLDLKSTKFSELASLVAGLATILHDLSEKDSVEFVSEALCKPCHPPIKSALQSIIRYRSSNYRTSTFSGVPIFEEKTLDQRHRATHYLCKWLENVPKSDLKGIPRMYIIGKLPVHDYAGTYLPHLAVVTLVWESSFHPFNPIHWLLRLGHEHTLYHEIGHHYYKHVEYGQVPEQERQANAYAKTLWIKAHPNFEKFKKPIRYMFRLIAMFR